MRKSTKLVVTGALGTTLAAGAIVGTVVSSQEGGDGTAAGSVAAKSSQGASLESTSGGSAAGGSDGSAKKGSAKKNGAPCTDKPYAKHKKFQDTRYVWENRHPWRASGWGPNGRLSAERGMKVANTVTGTFGASYQSISATVGFQVTKEDTAVIKYDKKLTKRAHYVVRVGRVYKDYVFNVYQMKGRWLVNMAPGGGGKCVSMKQVYIGTGKASEFWTLDYKWAITPKKKR